MTQPVTSSPSLRQASGFLSRRLQSRNARFWAAQVLAICRLTASSTEDTGTGASASAAIARAAGRLMRSATASLGQAGRRFATAQTALLIDVTRFARSLTG